MASPARREGRQVSFRRRVSVSTTATATPKTMLTEGMSWDAA